MICATCGVEYELPVPRVCPICADERQYVPAPGQRWTTVGELAADGHRIVAGDLEPDLLGLHAEPAVGIGQTSLLVTTPEGSVLWDPLGFIDDDAVAAVGARGPVLAIAASHPHMFGVQLDWSRALGNPPVLVNAEDAVWLGRTGPEVEFWSGTRPITRGVTLHHVGGHFAGSAVLHWAQGAEGRGVVLAGDSVAPNPDRSTVAFLRSYPNRIPLSGAVALRMAASLNWLDYDRLYGNFANVIATSAPDAVRFSAERHAAWAGGDHDRLT